MLRLIRLFFLLPLLAAALCSCASKEKEEENQYTGKFMQDDPARTADGKKSAASLSDVFQKAKDQREDKRLKFQDVSRPMDQDSYKVFPWRDDSTPRSERLHDASREGSNSIF